MLIQLNAVWYHYCEIGSSTVNGLLTANSAGSYYNKNIKGTGKDGPFDCGARPHSSNRARRMPECYAEVNVLMRSAIE